jgi:FKBP-type peptidyl-prolyl cis-trans isomerase
MRFLSLMLALAGLAAPGLAQPPPAPRFCVAVAPPDVAAAPADAETTASGLKSKVLTAGSGTTRPVPLDIVTVHYTGWTAEGRLFDSSVLRGRPSAFALDRIIAGWSEGLQLMVEGEKRRLWIPPGLAFEGLADRPQGPIVFDVELLDILGTPTAPPDVSAPPGDTERSGLASKVLESGRGSRHPVPTSTVTVHYSGWTADGKMFDSSVSRREPATFRLNEVIAGWTEGLQLMVEGEKRRFWIPEALAYGGRAGAPSGVIVFDVMLIAIDP